MIIMELSELFMPAELGDIIAPDMDLNGYRIKYQQSVSGTKIFTMCDHLYPNPPRCLIIINNNRISIAECDHNDPTSQTEIIRITKDDICENSFIVNNCTKSKTHTILNSIEKIKKAIDEKVRKNRTETNVGNEITITDDDIINIMATSIGVPNFTTFEVPCGNYKEIFIEDKNFPFAHIRYGFSRLDNIIQIIKRIANTETGSVENTDILVRLDTSTGTVELLISSPIAISIAHRLEEFIKNNKKEIKEDIKEEIKEEKNMPKIEVDFVETPKFVLKDIREAVEEWIIDDAGGNLPIKNGYGDSKEYWWPNAVDNGYIDIGLFALNHGFVIASRAAWDRTKSMNLFTITQMSNHEPNIRYVGDGPMTQTVENLKTALNEKYAAIKIEWRKTNKTKTKKTTKSGLEEYSLIDKRFSPYDIKNIKFNTTKKVTTVLFKDGTKIMTKATASDTFNPEVGLAMCIMKKLYGTRANYKRIVTAAMKNNEKSNKRIKEKADKKQKNQQAVIDHMEAHAESYME